MPQPLDPERDAAVAELVGLLRELAGTQGDEYVEVGPGTGEGPWMLQVAVLDEGPGDRFAVYAEYPLGRTLAEQLDWLPVGTEIDADDPGAATVTFPQLGVHEAAEAVWVWATRLADGEALGWSSTQE